MNRKPKFGGEALRLGTLGLLLTALASCTSVSQIWEEEPEFGLPASQTIQSTDVQSNSVAEPASTPADFYGNLPTGPRNTGTYPEIGVDPVSRIESVSQAEIDAVTVQMQLLAADHEAGRISTAVYQQRLAYLQALARRHSSDMLEQIGEPAS